jgi:hypothetical protein
MYGPYEPLPSGTRPNHSTKVSFNRIDFHQDDRFLPATSGPIRRDRWTCGAGHFRDANPNDPFMTAELKGHKTVKMKDGTLKRASQERDQIIPSQVKSR